MISKDSTPTKKLREYTVDNEKVSQIVADAIAQGDIVVINFSGKVYAALFDPRDKRGLSQAIVLKERTKEKNKPFSVLGDFEVIAKVGDENKIEHALFTVLTGVHRNAQNLVLPTDEVIRFREKVIEMYGDQCFLRFSTNSKKIQAEDIPDELLGMSPEDSNTMHLVSVEGHSSYKIQKEILKKLSKKYPNKIPIVGITSFNKPGRPSIKTREEARDLALEKEISVLVHASKTHSEQGSYSIISVDQGKWGEKFRPGNSTRDFISEAQVFFQSVVEFLQNLS